jgi:hypothetical protein
MSFITQQRMEKALAFLAETDAEVADWEGQVLRTEFMAECAESLAYKSLEGGVEERKRALKLIPEVQTAWENHFVAVVGKKNLEARRKRAIITIELYRTLEASRRQGHVL